MKQVISSILIATMLFAPLTALAQTSGSLTGNSGGVTPSTSCRPGQQVSASGGCVAQTLGPATVTIPTTKTTNPSAAALQQFNPNINIGAGNTYGGISISGVGGAIASCSNVGSFLVNGAASLLAQTAIGKTVGKALFGFVGSGTAVSTSDTKTQQEIATTNRISQCLDGVAYAVAKNTLAQVTTKTLNWVNTGLNGNPLYVQNVGSYLNSVKNQQIAAFLPTLQKSDPIFGNALQSAITFQITGNPGALGQLNTPLNTPQANSYNLFMADFSNGGWNSLLNPSYNPVGALFNASDKLATNIATQQLQSQNEIQRNNGFLDMKRCVQYANNGQVTSSTTNGAGLSTTPVCTQYVTDTPGSIIANQVATITTTPTRQLEYANKINEVLGNFFDSFVNNLLSKGLRGSGSGATVANLNFTSEGDNSISTSGLGDNSGLGYQASNTGSAIDTDFDISRPQQLYAILQTQYDFLNRTKDAQIALQRVIPSIGALDYCIPGPNPDWQNGLDNNWATFISSIQQANPKDPSTVEKIVDALPVVGSLLGGLVSIFTGSGSAPALWTANGILADKVTGSNVQITRTFYAPSGHADGVVTNDLEDALGLAYQSLTGTNQYSYYDVTGNTFQGSAVGNAFEQAAAAHPNASLDVDGFLQDAYTNTDSIIGYNQSATTIDQTYDQNISDTQNDIEQLEAIRKQVNSIVAVAKARYIKNNPGVNVQCLNNAYQINNSSITGAPRIEPDTNDPYLNEETGMVQHATDSASFFYNNLIK